MRVCDMAWLKIILVHAIFYKLARDNNGDIFYSFKSKAFFFSYVLEVWNNDTYDTYTFSISSTKRN